MLSSMAVCVPEIAGHDADSKFFVIIFVCEPRLFVRIGQKTALDDNGGAGEDPHEVDGAFSLLCLSAVFRVAAGDERRLERLGERLSECAVRGVKHLCAVVLRIAEFVEMNADKNRRGDALHDAFARVNIRDLVFAHRPRRGVVECALVRARHGGLNAEKAGESPDSLGDRQVDRLFADTAFGNCAAVKAAVC